MKLLFVLFQLIIAIAALGQSTPNPLHFGSFYISLDVSKDGSLALTSKIGEVGVAGSMADEWRRVDVTTNRVGSGVTLEKPCFFNKDTGFVSGFISSGRSIYDIIYHTTDGGKKWQPVNFGQNGWVDDAIHLDNGEAWLSVAGSGMAYTTDYGLTWKKFKIPDLKQRFTTIFFNTGRQGIVGSLWNMIAYTADNCDNWKLLPSPLDQGKYNKTNKESRPEFNRVAIFNNYFLAVQEDLLFYTKRDSINWIWLPEYNDFYTDAGNSALFFHKNKGGYVRSDDNFKPVHSLDVNETTYDAKCKNASLFVVCQSKMIQWKPDNDMVSTLFEEKMTAGKEPAFIGYRSGKTIGYLDKKILEQKQYDGPWDTLFTLPAIRENKPSLSLTQQGKLLYYRDDDSLFYFNFSGKLEKKTSKKAIIARFVKSGISELVFSEGSQGCFHNTSSRLTYTNLGDEYGQQVEVVGTKNSRRMPDNAGVIAEKDVTDFVDKLPELYSPDELKLQSIEDLGFTESDYDRCRKDILEFQTSLSKNDKRNRDDNEGKFAFYRNNLDFNRLLNLVDSIKYIDKKILADVLMDLETMWSTTTNWKSVALVNNENEVLSITSRYSRANAFFFPWTISLDGCRMVSLDININRFIEKVYPAFLDGPGKVTVLHALVKKLY